LADAYTQVSDGSASDPLTLRPDERSEEGAIITASDPLTPRPDERSEEGAISTAILPSWL
jgi:hypothetical protein